MKALQITLGTGILLALLWIAYELHRFNAGSIYVEGDIRTSGQMSVSGSVDAEVQGQGGMPIEMEIQR